jgi:histidine triad (HIT) family protein
VSDTIFHRILRGEISSEIAYEDDLCFAIHDIEPKAPTHLLLIPKEDLSTLLQAEDKHQHMLGHLLVTAPKIMKKIVGDRAFRVVINSGAEAGQSIFQLHLHLLSGRAFTWPPG